MSYLEIGGQRRSIPPGDVSIGSDPSSQIPLIGPGVASRHAIVHAASDGQVVIRKANDGLEVLINGVRLGPQPTPLLHGDKVQIATFELLFVDERRSGSTQYVQAVNPATLAPGKAGKKGAPTASTGGRLVSLTDGREYAVTSQSLVMGRDASSGVVLTGKNVSRRHAEIVATPKGYLLVDSSTNGTLVNGERVRGQRLLARADVLKLGDEEFRFYADAARNLGPAPVSATPAPPPPRPGPDPSAGSERRLSNTLFGIKAPAAQTPLAAQAAPRPDDAPSKDATGKSAAPASQAQRPVSRSNASGLLATLVGRTGAFKGQRFPIRVPVVNVGRAEYNDIVLPDDSVSTVHAKLQRREGVWVIVDLDSTNGTFLDGERVSGEAPIAPGALLRFGGIGVMFESTDDTIDPAKGSSTKMLQAIKLPPPPPGSSGGSSR